MKLYYSAMSPNCRKVTALVHYIGAKVTLETVDVMAGATEKPEFLKMNPNAKVPVLEDGKFYLWESNSIMQYIAEKTEAKEVWPTDLQGRADITRWQFWEACHWGEAVLTLTYERVFKPLVGGGTPDHGTVEGALEQFHLLAKVLNNQLEGKKFITGNKATIADFAIAGAATYYQAAKIPFAEYRHVNEWMQRIEQLEAWKKTQPPTR